jgi:hypothetical protein
MLPATPELPMTSHDPVTSDLLQTLDDVRTRTLARLDSLSDAEYLWEPVASCLTVRAGADGWFRADPRPGKGQVSAPFTTIAWRMWHIGADCLGGYGRFFPGGSPQGDDLHDWPGTALEGVQMLGADWERFRTHVESLGDDRLLQPMGPRAGAFAHESYLLLALHALDEAAHHGAELGVLRDLWLHSFAGKQQTAAP